MSDDMLILHCSKRILLDLIGDASEALRLRRCPHCERYIGFSGYVSPSVIKPWLDEWVNANFDKKGIYKVVHQE